MTNTWKRILLAVVFSSSLSTTVISGTVARSDSVDAHEDSPELCFLALGLTCVAGATACDANPFIPQSFCDFTFDLCLDVAEGFCFVDQK